jgi:cysteine synthase
VWAKLEYANPGGSLKDRAALGMILDAEERGLIRPGFTLVEPTAGNTGIGLALVGTARGYKVICVMPESFSVEKQKLIEVLGAKVVRTSTEEGMKGAIAKSKEILETTPDSRMLQQFENAANPNFHYRTTAPEIWAQVEGNLRAVVIGAGTGGTFTGVCRYVRERSPGVLRVLVQPQGSVFNGGAPGPHQVEGIGSSFVPDVLDLGLADRIVTVSDEDSLRTAGVVARVEGLLVGGSSGAVCHAALEVARECRPGERVVCIFPDPAERYLSKDYFNEYYLTGS